MKDRENESYLIQYRENNSLDKTEIVIYSLLFVLVFLVGILVFATM